MKTIKLIVAGMLLFLGSNTQAQVSVNVNIGTPPAWGPTGYSTVEFYYIPDIESYYDIRLSQFIYFNNGRWIHSRNLPRAYRHYDLYHGHTVVLSDYHGRAPYVYFKNHKAKYYKGYKGKPQKSIERKHAYYKAHKNDKFENKHNHRNNDHEYGNKRH